MTIIDMTTELLKQQKKLVQVQARIQELKQFLEESGYYDDQKQQQDQRNRDMYTMYKKGYSFKFIAQQFQLSATRVNVICRKEERLQRNGN